MPKTASTAKAKLKTAAVSKVPAGRRKRRSAEEIMQRLLSAAEEEFKLNGFRGATTSAIAQRAEVTEAQLFRYFDSKADIFREAIFNPLSQQLSEFNDQFINSDFDPDAGPEDLREHIRVYITELQKFIHEHSLAFMSLIVTEAYGRGQAEGLGGIESLATYFDRNEQVMSSRMSGKARIDPKLMVRVSFAAVLSNVLFKDWLYPGGMAKEEDISTAIVDFVIDGLNANAESEQHK